MPYIGELRALGLAKETVIGTKIVPPTRYLAYIPPASFGPAITLLESKGVRQISDVVAKVTQGPADLKGMKSKIELEPDNCGEILQACFGLDTKTGPADTTAYTHTFVRQSVSQLPTYTIWLDQGGTFSAYGGCMLNKLDLDIRAGELITLDADWTGINYAADSTRTTAYSALQPFSFNTAAFTIGGGGLTDYDNVKISIDNMVRADHVLNASIYPGKIYSEGMKVEVSADMYVESGNIAQWLTDYLTGVAQAFVATLTHPALVAGAATTHYSLTTTVPVLNYMTAPFPNPQAVLKIPFAGRAVYDLGSTNKTISMVLVNDVSSQY